jgi:hypothetical protein
LSFLECPYALIRLAIEIGTLTTTTQSAFAAKKGDYGKDKNGGNCNGKYLV